MGKAQKMLLLLQVVMVMALGLAWGCCEAEAGGRGGGVPRTSSQEMKYATVVPDWIDAYSNAPKLSFSASFGHTHIRIAKIMPRNRTLHAPSLRLQFPSSTKTSRLALFTALMVDTDPPSTSKPFLRNVIHWIVVNIIPEKGEMGEEIVPYGAPTPGIGIHRYYILIFKQTQRINPIPPSSRLNFSVRDFTEQFSLGYPMGGTYFYVRAGM